MAPTPPRLVLASTSRYRRELLTRLGLPFEVIGPSVDETPRPGESPHALAERLARAKADAVRRDLPGSVVIGSDQVADLAGYALGKPGDAATARMQLAAASGRTVVFHSAVAVLGPDGAVMAHRDLTTVQFRSLSAATIARYVELDSPLDCAGSFRAEGLGVTLFESVASEDPTGLIGLPLIWLAGALRAFGLDPLARR